MFYRAFLRNPHFRYLGAFYLHSLIRLLAVSMFHLFNGLYIYQILNGLGVEDYQSLAITSLFFSIMYLTQALSIAPSVWLVSRKGLKFSVFWGNIALVGFYLIMYFARFDPIFFFIAAIFGGFQIGLYWISYHIYFTELTDDKKQGEEISIGMVLASIVLIAGPAFGGLFIYYGGYSAVFLAMIVLVVLAVLPLKYLPKRKDTVAIDIIQTVKGLNPKKEFKSYLALFGLGGEIVYLVFWPIFIFPIMSGFAGVGFSGSLTAFITSIFTIIIGILIDKFGAKRLLNYISSLDAILWVFQSFVSTPVTVFIASFLRGIMSPGQTMSVDSLIYERARHEGLVSIIVQRETGLAMGRFLFLFVAGILFWFQFPLISIFILAAALSLLSRFYPETKLKE